MESLTTKEKILKASIFLFSEKGFDSVSMRDIAAYVGIKAASIYNHFESKEDILKSIYEFYVEQIRLGGPSLEKLLPMAETEHPYKVLEEIHFTFDPDIQEIMDRALLIASKGMKGAEDGINEQFLHEFLFNYTMALIIPVLNRMVELKKIEPIDVEAFAYIRTYYTFSAAVLNLSKMKIPWEKLNSGLSMINSLVKLKNEEAR